LFADIPQKSVVFLLKFYAFIVKKVSEMAVGSDHETFAFGAIVTAYIFQQVMQRNDGFGEFATIGSCHRKLQNYFLDLL
jgi:hypothetical protein